MTVPNLETVEAKAFVPTRDFEQSKRFLLQKFHVPDHTNNFQMSLLVEDVDAWWTHVAAAVKEFGVSVQEPDDRPWGLRDFPLIDPSGVLWRIGQRLPR